MGRAEIFGQLFDIGLDVMNTVLHAATKVPPQSLLYQELSLGQRVQALDFVRPSHAFVAMKFTWVVSWSTAFFPVRHSICAVV